MAPPNKTAGKAPMREPVTTEELDAMQAADGAPADAPQPLPGSPTGPTTGELEERAQNAEDRAEAAERRTAGLEEEMRLLRYQLEQLMRASQSPQRVADRAGAQNGEQWNGHPQFDELQPHGLVVGDEQVAYVQNGHQFGRNKEYVRTEERNMGCGRPFNPRLVGYVKPRPQQDAVDPLDGFRDR